MDYVYIEYPKCLYNQDGATMTVDNAEEESAAVGMGWATAGQYHEYLRHPAVVEQSDPVGDSSKEAKEEAKEEGA